MSALGEDWEATRAGERVRVLSLASHTRVVAGLEARIARMRRFNENVRRGLGMPYSSTDLEVMARIADMVYAQAPERAEHEGGR